MRCSRSGKGHQVAVFGLHHLAEVESTGARINDAMPTSVRQITLSTATIMVIWRNRALATAPFDALERSPRRAMKNIVRAGITAVVLSLGLVGFMYQNGRGVPQDDAAASWYQKAADQPTESARPKPIVITGNNGGVLRDFYERYRTQVAAGATFRIDGLCQLALLCSLGLTACASPSGPRLVSIRFGTTRAASQCKARVTV